MSPDVGLLGRFDLMGRPIRASVAGGRENAGLAGRPALITKENRIEKEQ